MEQISKQPEIGRGLLYFVFWVPMQAIIIVFLESAGLLPSRLAEWMGWEAYYYYGHYYIGLSPYTLICAFCGIIYTAVGCAILSHHGLNSREWWKRFSLWYLAYLPLSFIATYDCGSYILDIWFAPLLWLGELELFNWIQGEIEERGYWRKLDRMISVIYDKCKG